MEDLSQSQARPQFWTPIDIVARSVLSCHKSIEAVMVLSRDGEMLAYERALDRNPETTVEEYNLLSFSSPRDMIFFLRLRETQIGDEIRDRVERMIGLPYQRLGR